MKKRLEIIVCTLATLFRICLSQWLYAWYPHNTYYDDSLLFSNAMLHQYFRIPTNLSLVKNMGYSLFLDFVCATGFSYTFVLSLVWIVGAVLVVKVFQTFTSNKLFLTFVYLFVLFTPSAFEASIGTRLYRNSIIAPFALILFALMLSVVFKLLFSRDISWKYLLVGNISIGFIFTFSYYIKEDGIWLLACLVFYALLCILIAVLQHLKTNRKKVVQTLVFSAVPLLLFALGTHIYKSINLHFFSVYAINTRTEAELGEFVSNVYKIQSDDRSWHYWAPYDAIEKAFAASPTLQGYPALKDSLFNSNWFRSSENQTGIPGDFLTWVLRVSLRETGVWGVGEQLEPVTFVSVPPDAEKIVNDLFHQVNRELEQAFADGTLKRAGGFQLSSSSYGKNLDEMLALVKPVLAGYKVYVLLDTFEPGGVNAEYKTSAAQKPFQYASVLTNMSLGSFSEPAAIRFKEAKLSVANKTVSAIFKAYSILNLALVLIAFAALFLPVKCYGGTAKRVYSIKFCMLALLGICTVYLFGICWFSEFIFLGNGSVMLTAIIKYYGVGAVPLISLFQLCGLYLFLTGRRLAAVKSFLGHKTSVGGC